MMRRVETILDPEIEAQGWEKIRSTVEVDLEDGRRLVQKAAEQYRGGPDLPFTREDLHEKFTECAELVLGKAEVTETIRAVESMEDLPDITGLVSLLTPASVIMEER